MEDPVFEHIRTERCLIRRLEARDVDGFVAYRNDPELARYQGWTLPYTRDDGARLAADLVERAPGTAGEWFQFAVELAPLGELIGDCALHCDGGDPRLAELGFTFMKTHQGHGYAREVVQALLDYAFATLGIHRVVAITDDRNERAWRLLEALHFRREGHLIESRWSRGEWTSELLYAKLRRQGAPQLHAPAVA